MSPKGPEQEKAKPTAYVTTSNPLLVRFWIKWKWKWNTCHIMIVEISTIPEETQMRTLKIKENQWEIDGNRWKTVTIQQKGIWSGSSWRGRVCRRGKAALWAGLDRPWDATQAGRQWGAEVLYVLETVQAAFAARHLWLKDLQILGVYTFL